MDADLDTLCTYVYRTADDLLPDRPGNARRRTTDAEIVALWVAQAITGSTPDRRFLAYARKNLLHLFPEIPRQAGYHKRRRALSDALRWLLGVFAENSPGYYDDLLLIDSTPVECGRSRETARRSQLADAADYGYCASHSRYFWGFRLHAVFSADGTPRAFCPTSPKRDEREVDLELLERCSCQPGNVLVCDKGYASREFAEAVEQLEVALAHPVRKDEPGRSLHFAPIRRRIESIFFTCKDILTLERHRARTLASLAERVLQRFLCLAACICLNHQLGRRTRALVDYCA